MVCTICHRTVDDLPPPRDKNGTTASACVRCRERFGLPVDPPASPRPLKPCARCGGEILIRCLARERGAGDAWSDYLAPSSPPSGGKPR